MSDSGHPVGIDFGGSGIKGAPVDLKTGEYAQERVRIDTPQPATPHAVAEVFA
jgi:polyphosphate glucokinase